MGTEIPERSVERESLAWRVEVKPGCDFTLPGSTEALVNVQRLSTRRRLFLISI